MVNKSIVIVFGKVSFNQIKNIKKQIQVNYNELSFLTFLFYLFTTLVRHTDHTNRLL